MKKLSLTAALVCALALPLSAQMTPCGDCSLNGSGPDILDALSGAQLSAGVATPTAVQACSCDVDGNGMVTIIDALLMAQAAAGLMVPINCVTPTCGGGGGGATPTVMITAPAGGTQMGTVTITFDADDADMDPLAITFEYSTDAGATFQAATSAGTGSITANPAVGVAVPVTGATFDWDSLANGVGTAMVQSVVFRVTVSDGTLSANDTTNFDVDNVGMMATCTTVACGAMTAGSTGPGTGQFPAMTFTGGAGGDTQFFNIDVSSRAPGDSATILITNISDDVDLYLANVGVACGATVGASYTAASALVGLADEQVTLDDATLTMYGNMVPIAVYHFDPAPTATFDVVVTCVAPPSCTTVNCAGTVSGMTGPGTGGMVGQFTGGPTGDTAFFLIDVSGRAAGESAEITISNISDDVDLYWAATPATVCASTVIMDYVAGGLTIGLGNEVLVIDDATLTLFGDMVPIAVYHYDPAPTATFDVSVRCFTPMMGMCMTTVTCGSSVAGATGPGTGMFPVTLFTPGPGGDAEPILLDASGRAAGEGVMVRVDPTSDVDLYVPTGPGVVCGDPTAANFILAQSGGQALDLDEFHYFDDATLTAFGNMVPLWVYHYDTMAAAANFTLEAICAPDPTGTCGGTVEYVFNQLPVPIQVVGDPTGADDTSTIGCGFGGDPGGADHVILFVPDVTATYTISVCDPTFGATAHDTMIAIRDGDCSGGTEIACNDDAGCGPTGLVSEMASVPLTAGQSYYIVIDGYMGAAGLYVLDITSP